MKWCVRGHPPESLWSCIGTVTVEIAQMRVCVWGGGGVRVCLCVVWGGGGGGSGSICDHLLLTTVFPCTDNSIKTLWDLVLKTTWL